MRIFLSGPMGSGKSTVAAELAALSGLPSIDLDAEIEARTGGTVQALFERSGEAAFRRLEADTMAELLESRPDGIFALGGGTVTQQRLRHRLLWSGTLVTLHAPVEELAQRVGEGQGRPLLSGGDPGESLRAILEARADAYAECHARISTGGRAPAEIAREALEVAELDPIAVPLGARTYRVLVGRGVRARVGGMAADLAPGARVLLVSDGNVAPLWADDTRERLERAGLDVTPVVLEAGEEHKNIESVGRIWEQALDASFDRTGAVVTLGGGVVGDLGGFAASTLLRGVPVGHVATSLLAMADSAVGGKTGFDTRHGKNLVGTFHQPGFVLCDVELLSTLPDIERRAGLAEVVKAAWLEGEAAVRALEADAEALSSGDTAATARALRMAVALKARVVTEDEREGGVRALLNLGHTVGHAIEASLGYAGMRHGEAVALGMVAAFGLAERLGRASAGTQPRIGALLSRLGLDTNVGRYLNSSTLSYIGSDKKRKGANITLVLPGEPGDVCLAPMPLEELSSHLLALGTGH
ncbi:MAG: 3-dehydroquinate synthase [Myxococcales bacterium]|nr:3-dehydroquinate synthase [Myxococcales bacterium]